MRTSQSSSLLQYGGIGGVLAGGLFAALAIVALDDRAFCMRAASAL
jgi:hypothetical protein